MSVSCGIRIAWVAPWQAGIGSGVGLVECQNTEDVVALGSFKSCGWVTVHWLGTRPGGGKQNDLAR